MYKKLLSIILICILCLCSGCDYDYDMIVNGEVDFEKNPDCINVRVNGLDDSLLHCKHVCEYGNSYAYYDQGVIYYYDNLDSNPYKIECLDLKYMDMNKGYIYYTQGTGLKVFNKESKEITDITELGEVGGIDVSPEAVVVNCESKNFYEIKGAHIDRYTRIEYPFIYVSTDNVCTNMYGYSDIYVYNDGVIYLIHGEGYCITDEIGNEGEFHEFEGKNMGPDSSPEHVAIYDGKIYVLQQATLATGNVGLNMNYRHKKWDQIICFDPSTQTSESIYKTVGPEEQLVNFSVENDEMYLLIKGILYKTNLKGENKKEIANLCGIAPTLSFDYANDTLFVYDGEKLIGQYK